MNFTDRVRNKLLAPNKWHNMLYLDNAYYDYARMLLELRVVVLSVKLIPGKLMKHQLYIGCFVFHSVYHTMSLYYCKIQSHM